MTERDELTEEREFQDYLKRRRSPFPAEPDEMQPPEAVDRWVLQRARDGIRKSENPRPLKTSTWAIPFATAATVVIAVGLFINVDQEPPEPSMGDIAAVPAARDTSATKRGVAPAADTAVTVDLQADRYDEANVPELAPAPPPPAQAARIERERDADHRQVAAPSAPRARAEFAPAPPPSPAAAASSAAAQDVAANAAVAETTEPDTREAADRSVAVAASAVESRRLDSRDERSIGSGASAVVKTTGYRSDPNRWWAEIERLRAVGDAEKMELELSEFRKAYPEDQRGILVPAKP